MSKKEQIRLGIKDIRNELAKLNQEVRDTLAQDPLIVGPGNKIIIS